ncbi:acyl-CoA dehydrogenase, partial [Solihabitans fulvus]
MDLRFSAAEQRFRAEARTWLLTAVAGLPAEPSLTDWPGRRRYDTAWQRLLHRAGYAGIHWPAEYGGRGATPTEQLIFLEEAELAGAPYAAANFVGLMHAGPTLMAEGTREQRQRFLPPILSGNEVWCQGFSEPDAGSDLASVRTRAVRDGADYVVTGQKVWTSHAPVADFCELLVRTDPDAPKHRGLSWLIMPMDLAGIRIRPLRTIQGSDDFAEVFLDEVRVPVANLVGAEHDGWRVAMATLGFERGTVFVGELVHTKVLLGRLARLARDVGRWEDAGIRRELGGLAAECGGLWALTLRAVSAATRGEASGVGGSVFKLRYTELRQRVNELAARLLGPAALVLSDLDGLGNATHAQERLRGLSLTIAGGTSQIQR